jgi:hypothetical protein
VLENDARSQLNPHPPPGYPPDCLNGSATLRLQLIPSTPYAFIRRLETAILQQKGEKQGFEPHARMGEKSHPTRFSSSTD